MRSRSALFAAILSLAASAVLAADAVVYRIELVGKETVWSQDHPREAGNVLLFHRTPGGMLMSVKKADVKRVVATTVPPAAAKNPHAGEIVVGSTGDGSRTVAAGTAAAGTAAGSSAAVSGQPGPRPGERKDGTALFNPDRPYRPDWDSKQVPGVNVPFPASPNDYREGYVYAHPPANATIPAPGEPPTMKQGSGEVPRGPQ